MEPDSILFGLGQPVKPPKFPLITLPPSEQDEVVQICQQFKTQVMQTAALKKQVMQRCYAYANGRFMGDDLLPRPAAAGEDNDSPDHRPEIFLPLTRQQVKILYAFLKLTLFPNDEDYFRIRAETAAGVPFEEALTQGFQYLLKKGYFTRKGGQWLMDEIIFGNAVAYPTYKDNIVWGWDIVPHPETGQLQYVPRMIPGEPELTVEVWNPLHFYPDPYSNDPEHSKWGYFTNKRLREILDSPKYMNKQDLDVLASTELPDAQLNNDTLSLSVFNDMNPLFQDTEQNVPFDQYYFPYLKTSEREYRNMIVAVAGESVLVEFRPNLSPNGFNPVVFWTWTDNKDNAHGTGPVEDMQDIQRLVNIIINYVIENAARMGNRFVARPDVDFTNAFGIAGGVIQAENPVGDVVEIGGNMAFNEALLNLVGMLKAEAQMVAGSQDPFQGASNIDFHKTATEIQLLQSNSISILRDVVEHVSIGLKRILEKLLLLAAAVIKTPMEVPIDHPLTGETQFVHVDFSIINQMRFSIELMGSNPSQSKAAQVQELTQLMTLLAQNPHAIMIVEPILKQIGLLEGFKDIDGLLNDIKQRVAALPPPAPPPARGAHAAPAAASSPPQTPRPPFDLPSLLAYLQTVRSTEK